MSARSRRLIPPETIYVGPSVAPRLEQRNSNKYGALDEQLGKLKATMIPKSYLGISPNFPYEILDSDDHDESEKRSDYVKINQESTGCLGTKKLKTTHFDLTSKSQRTIIDLCFSDPEDSSGIGSVYLEANSTVDSSESDEESQYSFASFPTNDEAIGEKKARFPRGMIQYKMTRSPYEDSKSPEVGESMFEECSRILEPVRSKRLVVPSKEAIELLGEKAANIIVPFFKAVRASGSVYSSQWKGGTILDKKFSPIKPRHILICLHEVRIADAKCDVIHKIANDLEVLPIVAEAIKNWDLKYDWLLGTIGACKPIVSIHGKARQNFELCAIFVARSRVASELLQRPVDEYTLAGKIRACLERMKQYIEEASDAPIPLGAPLAGPDVKQKQPADDMPSEMNMSCSSTKSRKKNGVTKKSASAGRKQTKVTKTRGSATRRSPKGKHRKPTRQS